MGFEPRKGSGFFGFILGSCLGVAIIKKPCYLLWIPIMVPGNLNPETVNPKA